MLNHHTIATDAVGSIELGKIKVYQDPPLVPGVSM